MKKIKCLENNGYKLTIGNEYDLLKSEGDFHFLINDSGKTVRYGKKLFEELNEEVLEVPVPVQRTEQDMIDSIDWSEDDHLVFKDLNNEEVLIGGNNIFSYTLTDISCGIGQISGIDDLIAEIKNNVPDDDDYLNLQKALLNEYLQHKVINNISKAMWLISTAVNTQDEDLMNYMDELAGNVSNTVTNPNSGNQIRMWTFYTNL